MKGSKIISIVAFTSLAVYNLHTAQTTMFSNNLLWIFTFLLAFILRMIYRMKYIDAVSIVYIFWVLIHILDFFLQSLVYYLLPLCSIQNDLLLNAGWLRGIYMLIISACLYRFRERIQKLLQLVRTLKYRTMWELIIISVITVIFVYFQRIYIELVNEQYMRLWSILIMATIIVSGGVLVYIRKLQQEQREQLQQTKIDLLEANYRQAIQLYKEKSVLLHDEKHHIQVMNGFIKTGEPEKALAYGEQLNAKLDLTGTRVWSSHQFLDLVLNMKAQEAKENGIEMDIRFDDMSDLEMEESDICTLFFNLLDNAIEANQKIGSEEKRWIQIRGIRKGGLLFVHLANPMNGSLLGEKGQLLTTKADKVHHGFGMTSIQNVVDRYQGEMKYNADENQMFLELFIMAFNEN